MFLQVNTPPPAQQKSQVAKQVQQKRLRRGSIRYKPGAQSNPNIPLHQYHISHRTAAAGWEEMEGKWIRGLSAHVRVRAVLEQIPEGDFVQWECGDGGGGGDRDPVHPPTGIRVRGVLIGWVATHISDSYSGAGGEDRKIEMNTEKGVTRDGRTRTLTADLFCTSRCISIDLFPCARPLSLKTKTEKKIPQASRHSLEQSRRKRR